MASSAEENIATGSRFGFGANWYQFLAVLDEDRIVDAVESLRRLLQVDDLDGLAFLDIGSGSGLFSLAARRLGATVVSFDFDLQSVACTSELKKRYFPGDAQWQIAQGSALDRAYLETLGTFDIVYSWGVLHHTGAMWDGIDNAIDRVNQDNGLLCIAVYNDQGWKSRVWWWIKLSYNKLPKLLQPVFVNIVSAVTRVLVIMKYTLRLQPMVAIRPMIRDDSQRGMSARFDKIDWIGGFPYEYAAFDTLLDHLQQRGFRLVVANPDSSHGCHEITVRRV